MYDLGEAVDHIQIKAPELSSLSSLHSADKSQNSEFPYGSVQTCCTPLLAAIAGAIVGTAVG